MTAVTFAPEEIDALVALLEHHDRAVKRHGTFGQPKELMNRTAALRRVMRRLKDLENGG